METYRRVDAYCDACKEVRRHQIPEADHGACICLVCGHQQEVFDPAAMGNEEPDADEGLDTGPPSIAGGPPLDLGKQEPVR